MTINLKIPDIQELKPRIIVFGVGGAGGNAVNNMINAGLQGVDFVVANTDAQALTSSKAERIIQMGLQVTEGLGAGSQPEVGRAAAEEVIDEIRDHLSGVHMVFVTAGMGGGTGTGAAPVIARVAKEIGILTVGVVTKPFQFEGQRRMRIAEAGIIELQKSVDTLIVIPNQNLFRVANERTTFADAFAMADQVLYSGVACITDLMVKEGLINLDFADVRAVMREMGKAMMGTGEASGEKRALAAAEAAIANPLIDDSSMKGARGLLVSITGGKDLTLYEVDEAATRIREEVDQDANIIVGATFDESLDGIIRVSVVATGIDAIVGVQPSAGPETRIAELTHKLRADSQKIAQRAERFEVSPPPAQMNQAPAARQASAPMHEPVETAAQAAVAAAVLPVTAIEDVTIRPIPPKPSLFTEQMMQEQPVADVPPPDQFIPPAPERIAARTPRMPRIDELPMPAQNQLRAARQQQVEEEPSDKRRSMGGLLQRLAAVGLGRRAEDADVPPAPMVAPMPQAPVPAPQQQLRQAPQPQYQQPDPQMDRQQQLERQARQAERAARQAERAARQAARREQEPVSEYARRPAQQGHQGLDPHGRQAAHQSDDDQLDIPAFLRRQAN